LIQEEDEKNPNFRGETGRIGTGIRTPHIHEGEENDDERGRGSWVDDEIEKGKKKKEKKKNGRSQNGRGNGTT